MISEGGIVLPELSGWAGLKINCLWEQITYTTTGAKDVHTILCPLNKLWKVTFLLVACWENVSSNFHIRILDANNNIKGYLFFIPELPNFTSKYISCPFWLKENHKISFRVDVSIQPICFSYTIIIEEYDYGGEI